MTPQHKVIVIMSLPHSGSSLLQLVLGSHSRVFGLGELSRLYKIFDRHREGRLEICKICEGPCEIWDRRASHQVLRRYFTLRPRVPSAIVRRLSQLHRSIYSYAFEWTGQDVLVDSSKGIGWIKRQLSLPYQWRHVDPFLVFVTRDARALVNSHLHRAPGTTVEAAAAVWKKHVGPLVHFYEQFAPERKIQVAYESFAATPARTTRQICERIGLDFQPDMLNYWEHDHHIIDSNVGTRSLILRYRAEQAALTRGKAEQVLDQVRGVNGTHYDRLGLSIAPDLRWKDELTPDQIRAFYRVVGEENRQFEVAI